MPHPQRSVNPAAGAQQPQPRPGQQQRGGGFRDARDTETHFGAREGWAAAAAIQGAQVELGGLEENGSCDIA